MAAKASVDAKLSQTIESGTKATANETSTGYDFLYSNVSELEGLAREAIQERRRKECEEIIKQLEKGGPLGAQQLDTVRLFLIGDAEAYVKSENDVDFWRKEVTRLLGDLQRFQAGGIQEVETLLRLRALCQEAMKVLPDLAYFMEQRDRIRRFETATSSAMDEGRVQVLAGILRSMLDSDRL